MISTYEQRWRVLEPKRLMDEAAKQASLSDFGDLAFVEALTNVRNCFALDATFTVEGLGEFKSELVRLLVNRLRFQDDLKRHPEILEEDVSDPIVILGLPRSGTTKFHRMMGTDPGLLKTYMWQLLNPAPFPDAVPGEPDPRIAAAVAADKLLEDNPEIHKAQFYAANEIHEDLWLFLMTLNDTWILSGRQPSPSLTQWSRLRPRPSHLDNYRYVKQLFQYLQWQQGGRKGRRWLMKHTGHLAHLKELMSVYPKGLFVHIHRDPKHSIGSLANLVKNIWDLRMDGITSEYSGAYHFERTKHAIDEYLRLRENPEIDSKIFDVPYERVRSDAVSLIKEIYSRAGIPVTPAVEQGWLQWESENQQGKRGKHEYDLATLGLSEELIGEEFSEYIGRYVK